MKNPLFSRLLEDFIENPQRAIDAHKIVIFKFILKFVFCCRFPLECSCPSNCSHQTVEDRDSHKLFSAKNDALTQLIAVVYPDALGHQGIQCLADGILVECPLVEGGTLDPVRKDAILIRKGIFVLLFIFVRQLILGNPLAGEFQLSLQAPEVHQIAVLHRLAQFVAPPPEGRRCRRCFCRFPPWTYRASSMQPIMVW